MASRSDIQAGRAFVTLTLKSVEYKEGLDEARRMLVGFGERVLAVRSILSSLGLPQAASLMNRFADAADRAGRALLRFSGAVGLSAILPVKTFSDFDDAMREVRAVSEGTASEFERLTTVAEGLGAATSFTATQVAHLMAELGRAGFTPTEIEGMTGAVLDLARASGTDATVSSGIMAASLRQFRLGAEDATMVADALASAANKSFASVEGLGESLSYAGPVAADLGMSIQDTLAIIGGLGNVGIQGSEAGTAIRRLLTITAAEASKLQDIFGVAFVDAAGNARPLLDTLMEVDSATASLSSADRAAKFNEAFGLLGITAASAIGKAGLSIKDLNQAINASGGSARKAAADMDAGIGGAMRRLLSAIEAVGLAIGGAIADDISALANLLQNVAAGIAKFVKENKELVSGIGRMVAGAAILGGMLVAIGAVAAKVAGALSILGSMVSFVGTSVVVFGLLAKVAVVAGPIIASIASAIGSAVAASGLLGGALSVLGTVFSSVIVPIILPAAGILAGIVAVAAAASAGFVAMTVAAYKLTDPIRSLMPMLKAVGSGLMGVVAAMFRGDFSKAADLMIETMRAAFLTGIQSILTMVQNALTRLPGLIVGTGAGISSAVRFIVDKMKAAFATAWPAIQLGFRAVVSFARDAFDQLPQIAGYAAGRMARIVVDAFTTVAGWVNGLFERVITAVLESFKTLGDGIIKAIATGDFSAITDGMKKALSAAMAASTFNAAGFLAAAAPSMVDGFEGRTGPAFQVSQQTREAMDELTAGIQQTADKAKEAVGELNDSLSEAGNTGSSQIESSGIFQLLDPTPMDQYRSHVAALTTAFTSGFISEEKWRSGIEDAQRTILGLDPTPVQRFEQALAKLNDEMSATGMSSEEYERRLRQLQEEIFGLDVNPIDKFSDRLAFLKAALDEDKISFDQWAASVEDAKNAFLGTPDDEIDSYLARLEELKAARDADLISDEEYERAKEAARPEAAKRAEEESRTDDEKLAAELADLKRLRDADLIDDETFRRRKEQLEEKYAPKDEDKKDDKSPFVTFSAAALAASGRVAGVGTKDASAIVANPGDASGASAIAATAGKEAAKATVEDSGRKSEIREILELARRAVRAIDVMANGLTAR